EVGVVGGGGEGDALGAGAGGDALEAAAGDRRVHARGRLGALAVEDDQVEIGIGVLRHVGARAHVARAAVGAAVGVGDVQRDGDRAGDGAGEGVADLAAG